MGKRILAFSAHTGDIEITAGGTIIRNADDGGKCIIIHMFKPAGLWARPPEHTVKEYADLRLKQAIEASRKIGAEVRFIGCVEGVPYNGEDVKLSMCSIINEFKPDVILIHWKGSYHADHIACHLWAMQSLESILQNSKDGEKLVDFKKLYYPENWEDPQGFKPEICIDISEAFERYISVIKTYDFTSGKYSGFNYIDYYTCLKRLRGIEVGCKYAEAFMTYEDWGIKRVKFRNLPHD